MDPVGEATGLPHPHTWPRSAVPMSVRHADVEPGGQVVDQSVQPAGSGVTSGGAFAGVQDRGPDARQWRQRAGEHDVRAGVHPLPTSTTQVRPNDLAAHAQGPQLPPGDCARLHLGESAQRIWLGLGGSHGLTVTRLVARCADSGRVCGRLRAGEGLWTA